MQICRKFVLSLIFFKKISWSVKKGKRIQHILLFEFKRRAKEAEAARNIYGANGKNVIGKVRQENGSVV